MEQPAEPTCSGQTNSINDSEPDFSKWELDVPVTAAHMLLPDSSSQPRRPILRQRRIFVTKFGISGQSRDEDGKKIDGLASGNSASFDSNFEVGCSQVSRREKVGLASGNCGSVNQTQAKCG